MRQDVTGWQRHQLVYMEIICTLLQADSHANTSSLDFCRLISLLDAKPLEASTQQIRQVVDASCIQPDYWHTGRCWVVCCV